MIFDETVHLATIGGGFLRTPFMTATSDPATTVQTNQCPVQDPQIIHIPAAGRKSGLNLHQPTFRRAIFTSDLCRRMTTDAAAQANQEGAGITFGFNDEPHRNHARARLTPLMQMFGQPALFIDKSPINASRAVDIDVVPPHDMTTGFLAFVSRYWQDLRHVDPDILMQHQIPLQYDCDFNVIPISSQPFRAFLPIIGNRGSVRVYDPAFGVDSFVGNSAPISTAGSASVFPDGNGGFYIDLEITADVEAVLTMAVVDEAGQVFARNLMVQDAFPAGAVVAMPHGMVGVPYHYAMPCDQSLCRIFGANCTGVDIDNSILPDGLSFTVDRKAIVGIPTEYGSNFGVIPTGIPAEDMHAFGFALTINRPARSLLTICDTDGNDHATGEYYAAQFMPFGSILTYGGHAYEFRRYLSNSQPWPGICETAYAYGAASRQSAKTAERFMRGLAF